MKKQLKLNNRGIAHLVVLLAVVVVVVAVGIYFLVASRAATTYKVSTTADNTVQSLVNKERSSRGIASLTSGSILDGCALKQAKHMAATQTLAHTPTAELKKCITSDYKFIGENVGKGPSVAAIHAAFMKSASHKANILDKDYNRLGVGVVIDSKGTYWVVQVFRDPK